MALLFGRAAVSPRARDRRVSSLVAAGAGTYSADCQTGPPMSARFVHLHLHSEYSLADSTIRIPDLVARCVAHGQPSVAITDRNNLFALVKFYKAAEAAGLKPIAGADLCMAEDNEPPSTLTLLCRDRAGYLALSRLISRAWMEGQRHDGVVVRPQWLREGCDGLFALAGRHSMPGRLAAAGKHDLAERWLGDWRGVFADGLHLTLTHCGFDGETAYNEFALHAAAALRHSRGRQQRRALPRRRRLRRARGARLHRLGPRARRSEASARLQPRSST